MATYTADQFLGKTLFAKNDVVAYFRYPLSKEIFTIQGGAPIGVVKSWINKSSADGKLYWQFENSYGKLFYVQNNDKITLSKYDAQTMQTVEKKIEKEKEAEDKSEKGSLIYYIEKWGKKILIGGAIVYVGTQIIKTYAGRTKN